PAAKCALPPSSRPHSLMVASTRATIPRRAALCCRPSRCRFYLLRGTVFDRHDASCFQIARPLPIERSATLYLRLPRISREGESNVHCSEFAGKRTCTVTLCTANSVQCHSRSIPAEWTYFKNPLTASTGEIRPSES